MNLKWKKLTGDEIKKINSINQLFFLNQFYKIFIFLKNQLKEQVQILRKTKLNGCCEMLQGQVWKPRKKEKRKKKACRC